MNESISAGFSMNRLIQLCSRYFAIKKNMILLGGLAVFGLIAILYFLLVIFGLLPLRQSGVFGMMDLVFTVLSYAGYAFTSTMFNEVNTNSTATHFLTLPASSIEKLLSAWVVSYVCYTIVFIFSLYIISLILGVGNNFIFSEEIINRLLAYTILQSIFLFGAVYFKANNFLSTIVALLAFAVMASLIVLALDYVGFSKNGWVLSKFVKGDSTAALFKSVILTTTVSAFFIWLSLSRLKKRQLA